MPCGLEGNRRYGVASVMHHRLKWFIHRQAHGLDRDMSTPRTLSCGVDLPLRAQRRPASRSTPASPYFATHAHPVTAPFPLTRFSARSALISALLACCDCTAFYLILTVCFLTLMFHKVVRLSHTRTVERECCKGDDEVNGKGENLTPTIQKPLNRWSPKFV